MAVIRSHSLSVGIVGLPNSGKSTLFNALTKNSVPAENYPFCTIDKNVGVVKVPDSRLDAMAKFYNSAKVVPGAMTFVDIAGLVKGASKGEGLGNQFLGHIRDCNAIMYVLRAFKNEKVVHVYSEINPVEDLSTVRSELILKDIESVTKKSEELEGEAKKGMSDELKLKLSALKKLADGLNHEKPAVNIELDDEEAEFASELFLLTNKPAFYVLNIMGNVKEPEMAKWLTELKKNIAREEAEFIIKVDCKMEGELEGFDAESKKELTSAVENYQSIDDIIAMAFKRLDLITFYTGNEKEANAWSIGNGATVKEAAGVIHTDLEKGFVAAEVVNVEEMIKAEGHAKAKEKGIVRNEGRDYLVKDGDYINVLASK